MKLIERSVILNQILLFFSTSLDEWTQLLRQPDNRRKGAFPGRSVRTFHSVLCGARTTNLVYAGLKNSRREIIVSVLRDSVDFQKVENRFMKNIIKDHLVTN